ncbi:MAG: hypothetical protein AAF125_28040, partial [Chloroflexota bacterium]
MPIPCCGWRTPPRGSTRSRGILDDDIEAAAYGEDPDGAVTMALHVTRRNFPEVYIDTLDALRTGQSYNAIDTLVCTAFNQKGIPLDSLEWLGWGIPLPAYGVELDNPEFWTAHADAAPVLACFGISPEPNPYRIEIPDVTYRAAQIVEASLREQPDSTWQQVAELVSWLFSINGNSSVSMSYEIMAEIQPLSWDPDDVAFALEIIAEAEAIMADAIAALKALNNDSTMLNTLQTNIQAIYQSKG